MMEDVYGALDRIVNRVGIGRERIGILGQHWQCRGNAWHAWVS